MRIQLTNPELFATVFQNVTGSKLHHPTYAITTDSREIEKGVFPWAANGRALCLGCDEGFTKILADAHTGRILGAGIVGKNAGDLIAELGFAIEMGSDVEDVALTVHAHPTLGETVGMAAEACEGTLTDLFLPKATPKFVRQHD